MFSLEHFFSLSYFLSLSLSLSMHTFPPSLSLSLSHSLPLSIHTYIQCVPLQFFNLCVYRPIVTVQLREFFFSKVMSNQFFSTRCNTLQHIVKPGNTLQHTATHCNKWQHFSKVMSTAIFLNVISIAILHRIFGSEFFLEVFIKE